MKPLGLRTLAADRYRLTWDPAKQDEGRDSWLIRIPCRRGAFIAVHSDRLLSAFTKTRGMAEKMLAIPDVSAHQHGDVEAIVTFPPESLEAVAGMLQARVKRHVVLTDEQRQAKRAHMLRIRARNPNVRSAFQGVGHEGGPGGDSQGLQGASLGRERSQTAPTDSQAEGAV